MPRKKRGNLHFFFLIRVFGLFKHRMWLLQLFVVNRGTKQKNNLYAPQPPSNYFLLFFFCKMHNFWSHAALMSSCVFGHLNKANQNLSRRTRSQQGFLCASVFLQSSRDSLACFFFFPPFFLLWWNLYLTFAAKWMQVDGYSGRHRDPLFSRRPDRKSLGAKKCLFCFNPEMRVKHAGQDF